MQAARARRRAVRGILVRSLSAFLLLVRLALLGSERRLEVDMLRSVRVYIWLGAGRCQPRVFCPLCGYGER